MDAYLYGPVIAGMWKQHEIWDGTYSIDDLFDAHEFLSVTRENERRAYEASQREMM